MATLSFKGDPVHTIGDPPAAGTPAPAFVLTSTDLEDLALRAFADRRLVLNVFPSLDTSVCAASVRRFNQAAADLAGTEVLCISADLPFAHKRFCEAEGIEHVKSLSTFRHPEFGDAYGLRIADGPLQGLLARAVIVVGVDGKVIHTELVPEIAQEPDYEAALAALQP